MVDMTFCCILPKNFAGCPLMICFYLIITLLASWEIRWSLATTCKNSKIPLCPEKMQFQYLPLLQDYVRALDHTFSVPCLFLKSHHTTQEVKGTLNKFPQNVPPVHKPSSPARITSLGSKDTQTCPYLHAYSFCLPTFYLNEHVLYISLLFAAIAECQILRRNLLSTFGS